MSKHTEIDRIIRNEKRALRKSRVRNMGTAAFFVLPGLILVCVFILYPMFFNIRISFSNYDIVKRTMTWTGFDNFSALFSERGDKLGLAIIRPSVNTARTRNGPWTGSDLTFSERKP